MIFRSFRFSLVCWVWVLLLELGKRGCIGVEAKKSQLPTTFTPSFFNSTWGSLQNIAIGSPTTISISMDHEADQAVSWPPLVLCQTSAAAGEVVTWQNTWMVVQLPDTCNNAVNANGFNSNSPACTAKNQTIATTFIRGSEDGNYTNMFFCLGAVNPLDNVECESYSPFFNIDSGNPQQNDGDQSSTPTTPNGATVGEFPPTPTEPLHVGRQSSVLVVPGSAATSLLGPVVGRPSAAPASVNNSAPAAVPSATAAETDAPSPSSATSQVQPTTSEPKQLSTGAKVGIALSALALVFGLLLLALFLLRRTKRTRRSDPLNYDNDIPDTTPSHVLLTHHAQNTSRDMSAEKENEMVTPVESLIQEYGTNRGSTHPLTNNPTGGFQVHSSPDPPTMQPNPPSPHLTRGISNASALISPSTPSGRGNDAFTRFGSSGGTGDGRYLREVGMTEEEWEEERRIDLAIAEAERERGRS